MGTKIREVKWVKLRKFKNKPFSFSMVIHAIKYIVLRSFGGSRTVTKRTIDEVVIVAMLIKVTAKIFQLCVYN